MSAISAHSAVFARKALTGARVTSKRSAVKAKAAFSVSASARVDACDKNSVIVSPSILSANFATLGAEVRHARRTAIAIRSGFREAKSLVRARARDDRLAIASREAESTPKPSRPAERAPNAIIG
jgi:pyocin large subunit-like protein